MNETQHSILINSITISTVTLPAHVVTARVHTAQEMSIQGTTIATIITDDVDTIVSELSGEGSVDLTTQYGYVDVWGTDDDGNEWRVFVRAN